MAILTFLDPALVESGRHIRNDEEANGLLQELRRLTGQDWIVLVRACHRKLGWFRSKLIWDYTLYADAHGEWQVINLPTDQSGTGSGFVMHESSREYVMNYMLGYTAGLTAAYHAAVAKAAQ